MSMRLFFCSTYTKMGLKDPFQVLCLWRHTILRLYLHGGVSKTTAMVTQVLSGFLIGPFNNGVLWLATRHTVYVYYIYLFSFLISVFCSLS